MPSNSQQPIDVDAFDEINPRLHAKSDPSAAIVISDDEDEVVEVAVKLQPRDTRTRTSSADSDVAIVRPKAAAPDHNGVINLVSDDEEEAPKFNATKSTSATGKNGRRVAARRTPADVKPGLVAGSSKNQISRNRVTGTSQTPDVKPVVNASGSEPLRINKGPKSTIPHSLKGKGKRKADDVDSDEEYSYEHMSGLYPFRHPTEAPKDKERRWQLRAEPVQEVVQPILFKKPPYAHISTNPGFATIPRASSPDMYIWDFLRKSKFAPLSRIPPRFCSRKRPRLSEALDVDHYHLNHEFRRAGGSINKILQHDERVVICSNTAGGNVAGDTDPYNKPGTLISFSKRDPLKILDLEQGQQENLYGTHFSVHNIAYDPISKTLASSGADKNVRTWKFKEDDDSGNAYSELRPYRYTAKSKTTAPHDLAFQPGASILAVGEQRMTIENLATATSHAFHLVDAKREQGAHVTGAIAWGSAASSSLVFALSEPVMKDDYRGYHKAFDVEAITTLFAFDAPEAGDALCVDPAGDIVALVTNGGSESFLRIYDVRRQGGMAVRTRALEPFAKSSEDREVNNIAFSPDSLYLAIGRDDNCTHVYDSRMLGRGVLYNFCHKTSSDSKKSNSYGVVCVQWLESRLGRLGLVTGGNDGCVRLWDPLHAKDDGLVLAQAHSDIACFSFGDPFKGEHRLVVGDSDGTVYVMDGHAGGM
ncbi:WD40-repeat-containing domain protein [Mycena galericulata]|nr:WD40-repeat-containing domain protein [Mycena galericulata]